MATLGDVKKRVFALIEELNLDEKQYTDDPDYKAKINSIINEVNIELNSITKKAVKKEMEVIEGQEIRLDEELDRFFLLNKITGVMYERIDRFVKFLKDGTATIYYYQYPEQITDETEDNYKMDADTQTIECLIFGVASDILKSDVSSNYGTVYAQRFAELKSELDNRLGQGTFYIDGGI